MSKETYAIQAVTNEGGQVQEVASAEVCANAREGDGSFRGDGVDRGVEIDRGVEVEAGFGGVERSAWARGSGYIAKGS